ncbi:hypothetical protein FS749_016146 [Ceratobasidium sp. UAMH 11750]|nr:hypothetical protein FS749_016146 [Ceratobasidium sp. UAMH 11750]
MRTLTLNFDPLDCTCWSLPDGEYCAYCEAVCNTALWDFKSGVRDWVTAGGPSAFELAQDAEHQVALAEFFEEGRAPTPPPVNYMEDLREEPPGAGVQWLGGRKGKENQHPCTIAWSRRLVSKPYTQAGDQGKEKKDLTSYLVSLQ